MGSCAGGQETWRLEEREGQKGGKHEEEKMRGRQKERFVFVVK
jgi:hypothetical protein